MALRSLRRMELVDNAKFCSHTDAACRTLNHNMRNLFPAHDFGRDFVAIFEVVNVEEIKSKHSPTLCSQQKKGLLWHRCGLFVYTKGKAEKLRIWSLQGHPTSFLSQKRKHHNECETIELNNCVGTAADVRCFNDRTFRLIDIGVRIDQI